MFFKNNIISISNFPSQVEVCKKVYLIEVIFSKKKSSSVIIKNNKLIFRLSSNLSKKDIFKHFDELLKKILKKLEKLDPIIEKTISEVLQKGYFIFLNQKYFLKYSKSSGIKLLENTFNINFKANPIIIEKNIIKLLCEKYHLRLKNYVDALNLNSYNFKINGFVIKNLNSKWGHCTYDDKILLNLKLLNTDIEVLNYVIYHELSHIKHKNHSKAFWNEVAKFCPNYKVLRKVLKDKPPKIFN